MAKLVYLVYDLHVEENPAGRRLVQATHSSLEEAIAQAEEYVPGELVGVYSEPIDENGEPRGECLWSPP